MDDTSGVPGSKSCPVDFDHETPEHALNWPEEFREMRSKCPMAWTEKNGGFWVATRYSDIVSMAQNDATFSSFKTFNPETGESRGGISIPSTPIPRGLPVEADKPEWNPLRSYLNRKFAPKAAEARRPRARQYATALINRVIEKGEMDLVNDFTSPLPAMVTMDLMGLPLDEWRKFADPLHEISFTPKEDPSYMEVIRGVDWVFGRCVEVFEQCKNEPPNDGLLSYFAHEPLEGRILSVEEVVQFCNNILFGGVDTTTALTTNSLGYLHDHPADKQRLIDDPKLIPIAREEFVRFFTPIHGLGRNVTQETEVNGQKLEPGDRVLLAWSAGNRDPEIFENPEQVDITRFPNRHIAFGAGMHRCIGSFMARVMFEEMVAQIFERIPNYTIDMDNAHRYTSVGVINGWKNMPITFPPGPKVPCEIEL